MYSNSIQFAQPAKAEHIRDERKQLVDTVDDNDDCILEQQTNPKIIPRKLTLYNPQTLERRKNDKATL